MSDPTENDDACPDRLSSSRWRFCAVAAAALLAGCQVGLQPSDPPPVVDTAAEAIVNGELARGPDAVGALVYFYDDQPFIFCSGTLIAPDWVITAGHCTEGLNEDIEDWGLRVAFATGADLAAGIDEQVDVVGAVTHPDWDMSNLDNPSLSVLSDLGLVRLAHDMQTEPLPFRSSAIPGFWIGTEVRAQGYGITWDDGDTDGRRRYVDMPVSDLVGDRIETSDPEDEQTTCNGDSGGPVLRDLDGDWQLVGVNSYGYGSCVDGIYTAGAIRTDEHVGWIGEIIQLDELPEDEEPDGPTGECQEDRLLSCAALPEDAASLAGPGTTDAVDRYGCTPSLDHGGAEYTYLFVPESDGVYTVSLSGLSADLDLFLLRRDSPAGCDPTACLDASIEAGQSSEAITFAAQADQAYQLVVDGYAGAISDFLITLDCAEVDDDGDGFAADVDCDDTDDRIHPGAEEICDGIENDCDPVTDLDGTDVEEDGVLLCEATDGGGGWNNPPPSCSAAGTPGAPAAALLLVLSGAAWLRRRDG